MKTLVCFLALIAAIFFALPATADTLHLRDGRVIEGTIVEQTRSSVVIDAVISNITTRMTFRKREIESIVESDTPKTDTPVPSATPQATRKRTPAIAETQTRYLVVPISGVFGEEVGPSGVKSVFAHAQRRGIKHIVFHIDSPGGYVWAAEEISSIMGARPASITCYAVIDDAISAAIWVALSCDRIFIRSGGTIGGAVAYTQESTTGAVEVDAKMNSILAAKLAGMCAQNGHPEAIARAMVVYETSLYAAPNDDGTFRFSNQELPGAEKIDGETTVVTLTGSEVKRFGIGEVFDGDLDLLGERLGLENWTLASNFGAAAMKRGQRDLKKRSGLLASRQRLTTELSRIAEQVNLTNPNGPTYMIHEGGAMTSASIRLWRERTDMCIIACREMVRVIRELESLSKKATKMGIEDFLDQINLKELRKDAETRLDDLRHNRDRTSF